MTKLELIEELKDVSDDAEIIIELDGTELDVSEVNCYEHRKVAIIEVT